MSVFSDLIPSIGLAVAVVGGGIAFFNARKSVQWKRAELANSFLRELTSNQELVFACRALDWTGGVLVVPEMLRPLLTGEAKTIEHDPKVLEHALEPSLPLADLKSDERLELYRTAIDSLLSWLSLVGSALDRNLFAAEDIRDVGYWVRIIEEAGHLDAFIDAFGYVNSKHELRSAFRGFTYVDLRGRSPSAQAVPELVSQ